MIQKYIPLWEGLRKQATESGRQIPSRWQLDWSAYAREAKRLFKVKKINGWTLTLIFITTLAIGSEQGILIRMTFSLLVFIWRSSYPHTAELGYLEKENIIRNIERYPAAKTYPEALILRVDASLYFANTVFLDDLLRKRIVERPEVKWVVMNLSGVNDIDAVAIDNLENIMDNYRQRDIHFALTGMKDPVRDLILIAKAGWEEKYGERIRYLSIQHALKEIVLTG